MDLSCECGVTFSGGWRHVNACRHRKATGHVVAPKPMVWASHMFMPQSNASGRDEGLWWSSAAPFADDAVHARPQVWTARPASDLLRWLVAGDGTTKPPTAP